MGFNYQRDASGIVTVTMDMDGQSANTMSLVYHDLMGETVARLEAENDLTGVIFASAKKTFFAGGDLNALLRAETGDDDYKSWLNEDKGYLRRLEQLPVPVVAAINGAALGGGFEICLSCNHRIVVDRPDAIVGLPEVTLGLLPGAGGVARLPRLLELTQALDLLLTGRFVQPTEALTLGLVDRVVATQADLIPAAVEWILGDKAQATQPWDATLTARANNSLDADLDLIARTRANVVNRTRGKLPAPLRILDIIEKALGLDIDENLLLETENFAALLGLPETRAAISLNFFASNAIRSGKMRLQGAKTNLSSLAIMGEGPQAGALSKAASRKLDLQPVPQADTDMVLDFSGLDPVANMVKFHGLKVERLFSDMIDNGSDAPNRFGFRIPVTPANCKLVEIIAVPTTDKSTLCHAYDMFRRIGRTPIIVKDSPGHFIARLQMAYVSELLWLFTDGIDLPVIDEIAYRAGMTLTGTDILADPAVLSLVLAKFPGLDQDALSQSWDAVQALPRMHVATAPDDAADRVLFAQSIEGLRAFGEQVVDTVEECDFASVYACGFPPHTGGVLRFIHGMGVEVFATRAAELATRYGARFEISPSLLTALVGDATQAA